MHNLIILFWKNFKDRRMFIIDILLLSVQFCWKAFGSQGKLYEKASRRNYDQNGCSWTRIDEG